MPSHTHTCAFTHRQWKVGDPSDPSVKMGALISKDHLAKVKGYVEVARQEGATILCGDGVDPLELPERNKNVRRGVKTGGEGRGGEGSRGELRLE